MDEMMILENSVTDWKDRFTLAALNVGRSFQAVLKKVCRSRECQAPAWHLGLKNTAKLELGVPGYYAKPF